MILGVNTTILHLISQSSHHDLDIIIKWLYGEGYIYDYYTFNIAVKCGKLDNMKWLYNNISDRKLGHHEININLKRADIHIIE